MGLIVRAKGRRDDKHGRGSQGDGVARSLEALFICRRYRDWLHRFFTKLIECSPPLRTMRQLPVELSSVGREAESLARTDNIKSAPIWQNSRSIMALIRCTLPASNLPTISTLPLIRRFALILSSCPYSYLPSFPHSFDVIHPFSFTTSLLSTYNSPCIVRLFLFFSSLSLLPFLSTSNIPLYFCIIYPIRSSGTLATIVATASQSAFVCSPLSRIMAAHFLP